MIYLSNEYYSIYVTMTVSLTVYIGDIMGCGVDFDTDVGQNYVKVFFTKNGRQIGESQKMKRPVHGLYPLFGKFFLIA